MFSDEPQAALVATLRPRSRWLGVFAVLPLAIALFSAGAGAQTTGNRDFTLVNLSKFDIDKVSTSTATADVWTVLRNSSVPAGDSAEFKFDNAGTCVLQLRIDLTDGRYVEWDQGFDFCNLDTVTITYNGNDNTFNAKAQ